VYLDKYNIKLCYYIDPATGHESLTVVDESGLFLVSTKDQAPTHESVFPFEEQTLVFHPGQLQ